MNINRQQYKIVVRDPVTISNGMLITKDAFIELDAPNMRSDFLKFFQHYYNEGMIRVKVARIKPAEVQQ
jgi:hypothetical protein